MRPVVATLATAAALGLVLPASGDAAAAPGKTTLELSAAAERKLVRAGVRLSMGGPGRRKGRKLSLPVRDGSVSGVARLGHRGSLRLRARGGHTVRLRALALTLAATRSHATARFGGEQRTLLRLGQPQELPFNPLTGEVRLRRAPVRFTGRVRRELRRRLRVAKLPRRLGRISTRAQLAPAEGPKVEPPLLQRPPEAVDVSAATLTWRARESFIDYLHTAGANGGTSAGEGATPGPPEVIPPSSEPRTYHWELPFAHGWTQPSGGPSGLYFDGLVNFRKWVAPFWIDLDLRDPEVELAGADSRLIFTLTGRGSNADDQNRRAVAVDLRLEAMTPSVEPVPGGVRYTWERIPGAVPGGPTAWSLADFYRPGDRWGWATVSITVPEG